MYYRRKLLLATLQEFNGELNQTDFQKILFLITRKQNKKTFDFVPYKYGCYSFQSNQDLNTLEKYGKVAFVTDKKSSKWKINKNLNSFMSFLKIEDQSAILSVKRETNGMSQKALIKHTYINYPYYAIKSHIAKKLLSADEMSNVIRQKRNEESKHFFSIGYEGISLEMYLNKLIINNVKVLCDVRKNSLSMKYGFSKSQLKHACEGVGIVFIHIPSLGIDSGKRKNLNTFSDYDALFKEYENTTLKFQPESIKYLLELVQKYNRVAITCFEKDVKFCHRGRICSFLSSLPNWNIPIKNL